MARANVYNKEEKSKKSLKKLLAIIIPAGLVVIAGVVLLILWGVGVFDGEESVTYLEDYDDYKINYSQISSKLEDAETTFIFVYDNEAYDDLTEANRTDIESKLDRLIKEIDTANEDINADVFSLYIIDSSLSQNVTILNNETYGSISYTPQLMYFYHDTYYASVTAAIEANSSLKGQISEDNQDINFTNSTISSLISSLNEAYTLVEDMLAIATA